MSAGETSAVATLARLWRALPGNTRGAIWVLLGGLSITTMHALGKDLGQRFDTAQLTFFRCVIGMLLSLPLALALQGGIMGLRTQHMKLHIGRSIFGLASWFTAFYAVPRLPLADFTTMSFTLPLFITLLAVVILRETGTWQRWLATFVGFAGVLTAARPGGAGFDPATLVALSSAFFGACVIMVVKKTPITESPWVMLFYSNAISSAVTVVPAIAVWSMPTPGDFLLLILLGMFGLGAQITFILGMREGEASAIAPFDYMRLVFATIIGLLIFAEFPDEWSITGAAVIVAASFYIGRHEAQLARRAEADAPDD
ncbi:MAG: DMT family transporter [Alphaproteobacteria bacterium]